METLRQTGIPIVAISATGCEDMCPVMLPDNRGGIPPRILPALSDERFRAAFLHKGRFADLIARLPMHVILNPTAALLGAAYAGME